MSMAKSGLAKSCAKRLESQAPSVKSWHAMPKTAAVSPMHMRFRAHLKWPHISSLSLFVSSSTSDSLDSASLWHLFITMTPPPRANAKRSGVIIASITIV